MGGDPKKILLVDDESYLLEVLVEFLKMDSDKFSILTANSGRQALEIMAREDVFLVVSDIFMPEMSGIHLLGEIKERKPDTAVILMTAYSTPDIRFQARKGGCLHFIEKPFELARIRTLILEQMNKKEQGFAGTLKNIQLPDLIQMCCLASITITVKVVKENREGLVYIQDGEIVHAESAGGVYGEEAFYEILCWETGSFETLGSVIVPETSIEKSWQSLLMEAVRRIDEQCHENALHPEETLEPENEETLPPEMEETFSGKKIGVLIVEDSAMMFKALEKMLSQDESVTVLGRASNGAEALAKVDELEPDVITLDVNMPIMDGSTALKHIMIKNPCPVVIVSSMGSNSQTNILDFLRLGAVDFIAKPARGEDVEAYGRHLAEAVKTASAARIENFKRVKSHKSINGARLAETLKSECERLTVINSGPGGYAELMRLIPELPGILNCSILVFQNMAPEMLLPLSNYLGRTSPAQVVPLDLEQFAGQQVPLAGGYCYVSDVRTPMGLVRKEDKYCVEKIVLQAPGIGNFERFLLSAAKNFSGKVQVVLLSGAKIENPEVIGAIRKNGGQTIVQSPETSLTPFSLEKIIADGLADFIVAPMQIIDHILLK